MLHHYPFIGDRLIIGKFCAIAEGARFIMNGANHAMSGFSTYPFNIFGHGWEKGFDPDTLGEAKCAATRVIGNDVWIGMEAVILPGVKIGDGSIVAARSVVDARRAALFDRRRQSGQGGEDALRRQDDRGGCWRSPGGTGRSKRSRRNLNAIRGADISRLEAAA